MTQKNIAIQPDILWLLADQNTTGDTDFDGNGPVMYLDVSLYVANEYQLGMNCRVRFQETKSDWTTWAGTYSSIVFDIRNQGGQHKIVNVVTPSFHWHGELHGYGLHHREFGVGGIVQSFDAIGDSDGGAFGGDDSPLITVIFNNITIEVEDPPTVDLLWLLSIIAKWKYRFQPVPEKLQRRMEAARVLELQRLRAIINQGNAIVQ